jgi:N-acyl-D-aspartate/D-glutamate deacylase
MRWFVLLLAAGCGHAQTLDLLLTGGRVIDGSGSPERLADVGITRDLISFIGNAQAAHSLEDFSGAKRSNDEYLLQGVTTVVNGNDGSSPIDIGKVFEKWKRQGIGTNSALYIGQGSVRQEVMGMTDAAPTPEQLEAMRKLVRQSMTEGALGLSSGRFYAPGNYAQTR